MEGFRAHEGREEEEETKGRRRVSSLFEETDFRQQRGRDGNPPPSSWQQPGSEPSGEAPYLNLGKPRLEGALQRVRRG